MQTVHANSIPFQIIAQGTQSGFQTPENLVVRDNNTFGALWANLTSDNGAPPSLPQINFTTNMVIAAIMGLEPSCGYSINITSITNQTGNIVVNITKTTPQLGIERCMTQTSPYIIVETSRSNEATVFQKPATSPQPGNPSQAPTSALPPLLIIPTLAAIAGTIAILQLAKRSRLNHS